MKGGGGGEDMGEDEDATQGELATSVQGCAFQEGLQDDIVWLNDVVKTQVNDAGLKFDQESVVLCDGWDLKAPDTFTAPSPSVADEDSQAPQEVCACLSPRPLS